jgi:hypothetical protein
MEANMKHPKHSKPLRVAQIALALLVALAASTAAGQAGKPSAEQPKAAPVATGPSYGPVLHPQPIRSEPGAQPEQTPQAQEEKAGAAPTGRASEPDRDPDPSAHPAPQPKDPAKSQERKDGKKATNRSARRSAPLRVDPVAVAMTPTAPQPLPPTRPLTRDPGPVQINSCLGGTCTDTNGATYNTGVGNAAVNSQGRLCTRTANTMQCF